MHKSKDCFDCNAITYIEVHYVWKSSVLSDAELKAQNTTWYALCPPCARKDIANAKQESLYTKVLARRIGNSFVVEV